MFIEAFLSLLKSSVKPITVVYRKFPCKHASKISTIKTFILREARVIHEKFSPNIFGGPLLNYTTYLLLITKEVDTPDILYFCIHII